MAGKDETKELAQGSKLSKKHLGVKTKRDKSGKKRKTEEIAASGSDDEEKNVMDEMKNVRERLYVLMNDSVNEIDMSTSEKIVTVTNGYEQLIEKLVRENMRLKAKLDKNHGLNAVRESLKQDLVSMGNEMKGIMAKTIKECVRDETAKLGQQRMDVDEQVCEKNKRSYAVIVKSSANENLDDVREKVREAVKTNLNMRVKAVRKTKSGLAVEMTTEGECSQLQECESLRANGLVIERVKPVYPRAIIYDVPSECTDDILLNELYMRNVGNVVGNAVDFRKRVRVVMRSGKKDSNVCNVVIECPMSVRDMLVRNGRIYVEWRSFRVNVFEKVYRCYKCYGYNHRANECKKESVCRKCCMPGHKESVCKSVNVVCGVCREKKQRSDHSVLSDGCPEYVRRLVTMRERMETT